MLTYLMYIVYCANDLPTRRFQTYNLPAQDFKNNIEKSFDSIPYKNNFKVWFSCYLMYNECIIISIENIASQYNSWKSV